MLSLIEGAPMREWKIALRRLRLVAPWQQQERIRVARSDSRLL
jgi:hypothetical protein